jgi:hypothetical protein
LRWIKLHRDFPCDISMHVCIAAHLVYLS